MIAGAYLAALVVSIAGLATLDWRYRVAFFAHRSRTVITVAVGVMFFLLWDVAGVALGIFFRGEGASTYMTGVLVGPEIPLEEVFFLILLCYQTLLLYVAFARRLERERS